MNNPTPILTLEEDALLATLIATTSQLTNFIEERLPPKIKEEYKMLSQHSSNAWKVLYWKQCMELDSPDRGALFLRAMLATVNWELHAVAHALADIVDSGKTEHTTLDKLPTTTRSY